MTHEDYDQVPGWPQVALAVRKVAPWPGRADDLFPIRAMLRQFSADGVRPLWKRALLRRAALR